MRTVGPRLAAGSIAAGLLLSGCGGSPEPKPLPKPTQSASPSAPAAPAPPEMPAAARSKTDDGAKMFARHFVSLINYTARSGDRRALDAVSTPGCQSCKSIAQRSATIYEDGGHIRGRGWSVEHAYVVPNQRRKRVYVEMTIRQAPETVLKGSGSAPQQFKGGNHTFNLVATRQGAAWKVARLDLVA
jgi:hypothetical protein